MSEQHPEQHQAAPVAEQPAPGEPSAVLAPQAEDGTPTYTDPTYAPPAVAPAPGASVADGEQAHAALQALQTEQAAAEADPDPVAEVREQIKATEADQLEQHYAELNQARQDVRDLGATVQQREWLLVTGYLKKSKEEIQDDESLLLLALAWITEKREHGGASWDRLLDMTDDQLYSYHGFTAERRVAGHHFEQDDED